MERYSRFLLLAILFCGCGDSLESRGEALADKFRRLQVDAERFSRDVETAAKKIASEQERLGKLRDSVKPAVPAPNPAPLPLPNPSPTPDVKPIVPTPNPQPNPTPAPQPTPKPVDPEPADGRFAIAKRIYRIAAAVVTGDLKSDCLTLAGNFRHVSDLIKKGKTDSILLDKQAYNISVALAKLNKPFTDSHPAWNAPADQLGEAIEKLLNDGSIKSNDDWLEVFDEIVRALEAVARGG
jgi:hypothetical protein